MGKYLKNACILGFLGVFGTFSVLAQSSTNYQLKSYQFGAGGGFDNSSTNYKMEQSVGQEAAGEQSSTNYSLNSGLIFAQQANVPSAPTFVNDTGTQYNKLKITINKWSGDPTDAKYAVAISTDSFATTQWVQSDFTVGSVLGPEDFQTYTAWGGASGTYIIGLTPSTTYQVKAKAYEGNYTESGLGPSASAATVDSQIAMDIDIGGSVDPGETAPPYSINVGDLNIGSPTTASNRVWIDFDTNANNGGSVYVHDQNTGLKSTTFNYTITSTTTDLTSASEGYGAQVASVTQGSGGPFAKIAPYNGTGNNVGILDTTVREILWSSGSRIAAGRGSFQIIARASGTTPAADDYTDTLTVIASAAF